MAESDEWTDFLAMIDDIHAHVRATKREVELDDEPHRLRLGYRDPGSDRTWRIRLSTVKRDVFAQNKTYAELAKTVEGRLRLANLPLLTPL